MTTEFESLKKQLNMKIDDWISACKELDELEGRLKIIEVALGPWMSAALEDPEVCPEMKADIRIFFDAVSEQLPGRSSREER